MPAEITTPPPPQSIHTSRAAIRAFIALAVLTGPISTFISVPFYFSMPWQTPASIALSSLLAGAVLLGICVARKQPLLRAKHWLVIFVLLLPQLLASPLATPVILSFHALHQTPWGVAFLLALSAPLWLALLSALQLISVEVPRAVVGAAIAGIFAVCLIVPTNAYIVRPNQLPVLALELLLSILTVYTWAYAAPRLADANIIAAAGSYLLLSAISNAALSLLLDRNEWQPIDWRGAAVSLLLRVVVFACIWCLWFWLLQRISLAVFSMRTLAMWTVTMALGLIPFGFLSWRFDLALAIAIAALVISLRARPTEEQPTALGLRDS